MDIEIRDDFDLRKIHESGQCFRWEPIGDNAFRIPHQGECLCIRKLADGWYSLDCTPGEFEALWRPYFDLDEDYARIRSRIDRREDPYLYRASQAGQGIRILRQDLWETLIAFIISQNRNIPAIRRSVELLCHAAGERREDRSGRAYYSFPDPESVAALDDEALRECRLGYRCRYVKAAAEHVLDGKLNAGALQSVSDREVLEELMKVCGVGIKVASCVALFALHRTDAFPIDTWIRKVLETEYPAGWPYEKYRPYNGVFQQYLFAYRRSGD